MSYQSGYSDAIEYALDLLEPAYFDFVEAGELDELLNTIKTIIQDLHNAKDNTNK